MRLFSTIFISLIFVLISLTGNFSSAATIDELNDKINQQRAEIKKIEAEIRLQEQKVTEARGERKTVESVVAELTASRNKILADVRETESQIKKADLTIEKIGLEISEKEQGIQEKKTVLAENIKTLNQMEQISTLEVLLTYDSFAEFWAQISERETFTESVNNAVRELEGFKQDLTVKQTEEEEEKEELKKFHTELAGEREAVETTKKQKDQLLSLAKNKELTYQQILDQKLAQKKIIEKAVNDYESQLKIILDKDAFASAENGVLAWPIERRPIVITQNFGGTEFAKTNPGVYGRPFHNGMDIDLETGDKVLSAYNGTVRATGNTDAVPGCYSWGKWVLVDHTNGLTSLSAHLSAITVSPGQQVSTGSQIGLGGNTGFSTGSHLHFTLYATQGVQVQKFEQFKTSTSCAGASTPVAPHDAYLDPGNYFPRA